jgi:hypothetical protein
LNPKDFLCQLLDMRLRKKQTAGIRWFLHGALLHGENLAVSHAYGLRLVV